jgi:hypothetical protein
LAGAFSLGSAASAETYSDPLGLVHVGTNGSDAGTGSYYLDLVAVSHGGCAQAVLAVAIGETNRSCGPFSPEHDAVGFVGVGLLGADSYGTVVTISDTGHAEGCSEPLWFDCITSIAVSGTGPASGRDLTVSGTGRSDSELVGVSGTGVSTGSFSVSGTGNAEPRSDGYNALAVSGTGTANGGTVAIAGGDAHANGGWVAVSATGDASGGSILNVDGE